ncbi:hypothetical protein BS47DRAFT_1370340 [Hydnum rufescens UP504]|uniref:FAM50A/XAP5 C-terminal domain-containing protein n=1 Tax=Hydnum rufescens UP504 TaxID=1448309 RepID=A0A9P6E0E0_9AGAM|nr:hypothetical protein BS47DRAFT_1370340 [Hydnum rufescens UP504]
MEETQKKPTVRLEDFQDKQRELEEAKAGAAAQTDELKRKKTMKKRKKKRFKPSFTMDDEGPALKRAKPIKNPSVDTSVLPDREREDELRQEWLHKQEAVKNEETKIVYSYWDGSGHRKSVKAHPSHVISQLLVKCTPQHFFRTSGSVDNFVYIKENLIIPHHYTSYDFIVYDDVRLIADAIIEKDAVVAQSGYQRSKHIFPALRWEVFGPEKQCGKYTIA